MSDKPTVGRIAFGPGTDTTDPKGTVEGRLRRQLEYLHQYTDAKDAEIESLRAELERYRKWFSDNAALLATHGIGGFRFESETTKDREHCPKCNVREGEEHAPDCPLPQGTIARA